MDDATLSLPPASSHAVDVTVARRSRALLYTTRIAAIEDARRRSQDERLVAYDAVALALHALDAVAVRMDLESGATWEEAAQEVAAQAARQDPGGAREAHEAVADWLLRQLIDEHDAAWTAVEEGEPVTRSHRVYLLYETEQAGHHHLRARDQAINVLVDALDLDIDSAQAAAEARLEHLVRRGRHDEAYAAARESRLQSVRLMDRVREDLREAERDLDSEHWTSTVAPRLSGALQHVVERIDVERRLKELVEGSAERAGERDFRWIPRTVELLDDCLGRHRSLQTVLAGAGDTFLLEQQRQHLVPRARRAFPHPVNELLVGVLERTGEGAWPLLERCERVFGARAPRLLSDWAGVDVLGAEPGVPDEHGAPVDEVQLVADREPTLLTEQQLEQARRALEAVGEQPVRAADIMRGLEEPVAHLLGLLALGQRAPELELLHARGASSALIALPDGERDDGGHGPEGRVGRDGAAAGAPSPFHPDLRLVRVSLADPDVTPEGA